MKYNEVLRQELESLERVHSGEAPPQGIPTKLREFDVRGGIKRGTVSMFAAQSGFGKSMWAHHLMWAAASEGYTVTWVAMEDPVPQTAHRTMALASGINSAQMSSEVTDEQLVRLKLATADAEEWSERVEFLHGVKTGKEALELFEEHPADLQILDYLSAFPRGKNGREAEISDFMWAWTRYAQDTNTAAVALAQVNNDPSERGLQAVASWRKWGAKDNPTPPIDAFRMFDWSDLAWCTDAGRNAKEFYSMFRPGEILRKLGFPGEDNVMEFDTPKRNFGSSGRLRVGVDLKTARFYDLPSKEKKGGKKQEG